MRCTTRSAPVRLGAPRRAADDDEWPLGLVEEVARLLEIRSGGCHARHGVPKCIGRTSTSRRACPPGGRAQPVPAVPRSQRGMRGRRAQGSGRHRRSAPPTWPSARTSAGSRSPEMPRAPSSRGSPARSGGSSESSPGSAVWTPPAACVAPGPRVTMQMPDRPTAPRTRPPCLRRRPRRRHETNRIGGRGERIQDGEVSFSRHPERQLDPVNDELVDDAMAAGPHRERLGAEIHGRLLQLRRSSSAESTYRICTSPPIRRQDQNADKGCRLVQRRCRDTGSGPDSTRPHPGPYETVCPSISMSSSPWRRYRSQARDACAYTRFSGGSRSGRSDVPVGDGRAGSDARGVRLGLLRVLVELPDERAPFDVRLAEIGCVGGEVVDDTVAPERLRHPSGTRTGEPHAGDSIAPAAPACPSGTSDGHARRGARQRLAPTTCSGGLHPKGREGTRGTVVSGQDPRVARQQQSTGKARYAFQSQLSLSGTSARRRSRSSAPSRTTSRHLRSRRPPRRRLRHLIALQRSAQRPRRRAASRSPRGVPRRLPTS